VSDSPQDENQTPELAGVRLERLLAGFSPDRNEAADKYSDLQNKLIRFFERDYRVAHFHPPELADEAFRRVADHLLKADAGEHVKIEDVTKYTFGVAKFILLEFAKRRVPQPLPPQLEQIPMKQNEDEEETDLVLRTCLRQCLNDLSDSDRVLILCYYRKDKAAKIDDRKKLAEDLDISPEYLRKKAERIRGRLATCIGECRKTLS